MTRTRRPAGAPSLTATVPRQFVHRAAVAETLLTGWERTGEHRFTVFAQWPRAHGLHVSSDWLSYDPLLVVETVRQAGTLVSHTEYDVPLDWQFVLNEFHVTTLPGQLTVGPVPAELAVELAFTDVRLRAGRLAACRYTALVLRRGEPAASADVAFSCVGAAVYRRLRGGRTAESVVPVPVPAGLSPESVGRALAADVVLAGLPEVASFAARAPETGTGPFDPVRELPRRRWQLRVNTAHPVFFDHPLDHAPGMLLMEAARQAAHRSAPGQHPPADYRAVFHRYAELDEPVWIEAADTPGGEIQVTAVQGESAVFHCVVGTAAR